MDRRWTHSKVENPQPPSSVVSFLAVHDVNGQNHVGADLTMCVSCESTTLLAEYECTEWGPAAGPASSDAPVAMAGHAGTKNPNADGTGHSNPPSALPSLVLPPLSMLFVSSQGEGQHHSNSEAQQQAGDRPPADPSQRIITAHLMQCWKDHQYVLGHVALAQ